MCFGLCVANILSFKYIILFSSWSRGRYFQNTASLSFFSSMECLVGYCTTVACNALEAMLKSSGERLDIHARGFWIAGQDPFFDVRVFHLNAPSKRSRRLSQHTRNMKMRRRENMVWTFSMVYSHP